MTERRETLLGGDVWSISIPVERCCNSKMESDIEEGWLGEFCCCWSYLLLVLFEDIIGKPHECLEQLLVSDRVCL